MIHLQDLQRLSDQDREKLRAIRRLATDAMLANGLGDWVFEWTGHRKWMGSCLSAPDFEAGIISLSVIYCLSNPISVARETILHEVGHALTPGHGHDDLWKAKAAALGCLDLNPCATGINAPPLNKRFWACCSWCHTVFRMNRPKVGTVYACPKCHSEHPELAILTWNDSRAVQV